MGFKARAQKIRLPPPVLSSSPTWPAAASSERERRGDQNKVLFRCLLLTELAGCKSEPGKMPGALKEREREEGREMP
jgi:hypothetical protein